MTIFQEILGKIFAQGSGESQFAFDDIYIKVNEGLTGDEAFTLMEAEAALSQMSNDNKVMYSDGVVYII